MIEWSRSVRHPPLRSWIEPLDGSAGFQPALFGARGSGGEGLNNAGLGKLGHGTVPSCGPDQIADVASRE